MYNGIANKLRTGPITKLDSDSDDSISTASAEEKHTKGNTKAAGSKSRAVQGKLKRLEMQDLAQEANKVSFKRKLKEDLRNEQEQPSEKKTPTVKKKRKKGSKEEKNKKSVVDILV
eukprot:TRINITY_DN83624_c0_g1_i2.p2 TRINITY_DN83624_c0_g1~~TRINITY_DN83624_c0_g1_i2.p2  ORF type:complete len:116 (+),score=19.14 TRINITY_DN83624_c0_g1_i2:340-687(+)